MKETKLAHPILVDYIKWTSEHNEDYCYDEIHEFFADKMRGDIKDFMDWVCNNTIYK